MTYGVVSCTTADLLFNICTQALKELSDAQVPAFCHDLGIVDRVI